MARRLAAERFIGRADLLELFDEMLASSHEGRGDVLLISGEAGVGKSRAIAELTSRAQRDGAVVLVGWCVENGDQILPLAPVADILRDMATLYQEAEFDQAHGLDGDVLGRLVPDLVTVSHVRRRGVCSMECWTPCAP
jgi:predicted ATPase